MFSSNKNVVLGRNDPGTKSGRKIPFGCSPWRAIAKPTLESIGLDLFFNVDKHGFTGIIYAWKKEYEKNEISLS